MKLGLETIRTVCAALGDPQRTFRAVHVAGTNGKGAVCAMLDAALRASGLRVGRYTSPHLVRLNERFFLDGVPLDDATLDAASKRVAAVAPADLTFFEALTAVAFLVYKEKGVDYAVLETGLGGRLDATNICAPALTVITRIGLDHCDWLGDTVEKIAAEKGGIIKPGVPVVLGANEPTVRRVIEDIARRLGSPFHYAPDLARVSDIPPGFPLLGSFNRENAVTALAALRVLGAGDPSGLTRTVWPGRFQRVGRFLIDGAHNPPAARALAAALAEAFEHSSIRAFEPSSRKDSNAQALGCSNASLALIAGFCGDKDVDATLRILAPFCARGVAVRTHNPRALSPEAVAEKMTAAGIPAEPCDSLAEALRRTSGPTLVCGSLFLAGEALVALGAYPGTPRFDPSEALRPTP